MRQVGLDNQEQHQRQAPSTATALRQTQDPIILLSVRRCCWELLLLLRAAVSEACIGCVDGGAV